MTVETDKATKPATAKSKPAKVAPVAPSPDLDAASATATDAPRDRIADKADEIKSKTEALKGKASAKAEELKGKANAKTGEMKEKAGEFRTKAAEKARGAANEGKARTGAALHSLSKLIEDNANTIDESVGTKYGDYARSAADAVSKFGDRVDEKDVDEIVEDAREIVRKSSVAAVGAAAALGFVVARLMSGKKKS